MFLDNEFLDLFPELRDANHGSFERGMHFASRKQKGYSLEYLQRVYAHTLAANPYYLTNLVANKPFANAFTTFDTWTLNGDRATPNDPGRPINNPGNLFLRRISGSRLEMVMIDQGLAFNGDWHFHPDPNARAAARLGNWPDLLVCD